MSPNDPLTDEARQAVDELLELPQEDESNHDMDEPDLSYEMDSAVTDAPLADADISALVTAALERVEEMNLVFPDAEALIEQTIVALLSGHLVLHGPPGTGKTVLAQLLCEVFDCEEKTVTGTPEWSTYDVVGGLRPAIGKHGNEVLQPWLGYVPAAALRCGAAVDANLSTGDGPQAAWLVIDELSRADIDKAVGPLYTALSGKRASQRVIDLWFEDTPQRSRIVLPERFRIVATMNDVDTAFVNQLSQGLQRRFEFVLVEVPADSQTEEELAEVSRQAAKWYGALYGGVEETDLKSYADTFVEEPRVTGARVLLVDLARFLRWAEEGPRWPVGSAQLADVMREVALRAHSDASVEDLTESVDTAVANRVIPQASALTDEQFDAIEAWIADKPLPRALRALRQTREPHLTIGE